MSSDFDTVGGQESVELTAGLFAKLENHFNEAAAVFVAEQVGEVRGDLIRRCRLASVGTVALRIDGEDVTAQQAWSQCEACQQG